MECCGLNNDKFYTHPLVVKTLVHQLRVFCVGREITHVIEPSAGDGAFLQEISYSFPASNKVYLDILPEDVRITRMDWFDWRLGETVENSVVIGNPPFGKNSSLAVKFFNKAATHSPIFIAFVLPKTFMKRRFWTKLDQRYSLLWQEECGKNSFTMDGKIHDVPCVMQIWGQKTREDRLPTVLELFKEVEPSVATCFIRRAGGKAGRIVDSYTPSSTYSVQCSNETNIRLAEMKDEIKEQASKTVGVRSITLLEIEDILLRRACDT